MLHREIDSDYQRLAHIIKEERQRANTTNEILPECNICTLNCCLEEMAALNFLWEQPKATQKEITVHIGKSERTVKNITVKLAEKGIFKQKNGKRNGFGEIKTMA